MQQYFCIVRSATASLNEQYRGPMGSPVLILLSISHSIQGGNEYSPVIAIALD